MIKLIHCLHISCCGGSPLDVQRKFCVLKQKLFEGKLALKLAIGTINEFAVTTSLTVVI